MSDGNTATPPTDMQRSNAAGARALTPDLVVTRAPAEPTTRSRPARSREPLDGRNPRSAKQRRRPRPPVPCPISSASSRVRRAGRADQPADQIEPVDAGEQRPGGLIARDLRRQHRPLAHVREVRQHRVIRPIVRADRKYRTRRRGRDGRRWPARRRQRRARRRAPHRQVRPFVLQRQRDRATARPDIRHTPPGGSASADLDQQLGLGPRDQHPPVDADLDPAKPLAPEDVRDRLARFTTRKQLREARVVQQRRGSRSSSNRSRRTPRTSASSSSASSRGVSHPAASRWSVADEIATPRVTAATASATRLLLQPTPLLVVLERVGQLVELAHQDPVEVVDQQVDPVVLDPPLTVVVGPDLLGAVAGTDLGARLASIDARCSASARS